MQSLATKYNDNLAPKSAMIWAFLSNGDMVSIPKQYCQDYLHLQLPIAGSTIEFLADSVWSVK